LKSKLLKPIEEQHWQINAEFLASNPENIAERTRERVSLEIPAIESVLRRAPDRFPADKWLLSSAVQKLIRRGRADNAVRTALALHALDPAYLPRRLPTIAFEDISIGDLQVCFDVLHVFGNQRFASGTSVSVQRRLIANLVYRLAQSVKSRTACDILSLGMALPEFLTIAKKMAGTSARCLVKIAADRNAPDTRRTIALYVLSGLSVPAGRWYRPISRFNADALNAVAEKLELLPVIAWMMIKGRNTSGLAAMLPLALEAVASDPAGVQIKHFENRSGNAGAENSILGVPAFAADMYTSIGKRAIREFAKQVKEKHATLFSEMRAPASLSKLVGMAIFHVEGSKLDRWLENERVSEYRERVERTELKVLGLAPELHQKLYDVLNAESELLWTIRRSQLRAAFGTNQGESHG